MSSKEANELARQYENAGYMVEKSGGHNKVYTSDGRFVTTFASTPSTTRSSRVDRIRFGQVLTGKPILGRRPATPREVPSRAVAEQTVADVPAAFRKADRRAHEAELAARETGVLSRAGSLDGINHVGDLFASITTNPTPSILDRFAFAERMDGHRRDRAGRKQRKRAGRAWNSVEREAEAVYRAKGFVDPTTDLADLSGTCVACFQPCDTVFAPSFAEAEGHIAFLELLGLPADQAYVTFRGHWNEAHPMFQIDDGKIPEDYVIAGTQIPARVCQDCFDNFQKVAWGKAHRRLKDHPLPGTDQSGRKLYGYAYEFDGIDGGEDGPEVYKRNKAVAEAAMRLEQAVVEARETDQVVSLRVEDARLMESVGYQFPPGLM